MTVQPRMTEDQIVAMKRNYLALFEPGSVAVVGASSSPLKWGFRILYNTIIGGYKGALYAVNPKHEEIVGVQCFPSISAIPERIDLVLLVLPPKYVLDGLRECAQCGVRAVIVITAGFGETADEQAVAAQREMARIAQEAGMLLVGPNCAGVASPDPHRLYGGMLYRHPAGGGCRSRRRAATWA